MTPKQELGKVPKGDIVGGGADGAKQRAFLYVIDAEMMVLPVTAANRQGVRVQSVLRTLGQSRERMLTQICKPDLSPSRVRCAERLSHRVE